MSNISHWYWLARGPADDRHHTCWYWCANCRRWEFEIERHLSPAQVAAGHWELLGRAARPLDPVIQALRKSGPAHV